MAPDRQTLLHESWKPQRMTDHIKDATYSEFSFSALPQARHKTTGSLTPLRITSLSSLWTFIHFLEPRTQYQKRTSAPNLVAPNHFPSPFPLPLKNIPNIHAVSPKQTAYAQTYCSTWRSRGSQIHRLDLQSCPAISNAKEARHLIWTAEISNLGNPETIYCPHAHSFPDTLHVVSYIACVW